MYYVKFRGGYESFWPGKVDRKFQHKWMDTQSKALDIMKANPKINSDHFRLFALVFFIGCSTWLTKKRREREESIDDLILSICSSLSCNSFNYLIKALQISIWASDSILSNYPLNVRCSLANHLNIMNIISKYSIREIIVDYYYHSCYRNGKWLTNITIACHIHCGIFTSFHTKIHIY